MRWRTRFGAVFGRLSVGRPYARKWPFVVRRCGRCWMYGPNYVKLSRVFAAQLLSVVVVHYAALPPVRSGPHWPHSHAITTSIRLPRPRPGTATAAPGARDPNLDSGNHDISRLSAFAYLGDAPIQPGPYRHTPGLLLPTDIGCGALAAWVACF
jgi:hypothetical protein